MTTTRTVAQDPAPDAGDLVPPMLIARPLLIRFVSIAAAGRDHRKARTGQEHAPRSVRDNVF